MIQRREYLVYRNIQVCKTKTFQGNVKWGSPEGLPGPGRWMKSNAFPKKDAEKGCWASLCDHRKACQKPRGCILETPQKVGKKFSTAHGPFCSFCPPSLTLYQLCVMVRKSCNLIGLKWNASKAFICFYNCCGLNVYVPSKFLCWNPNPQDEHMRRWDPWEVLHPHEWN